MVTSLDVLKVSPAGQARGIYGNVGFTYNFIFWSEMLRKQWKEFCQRRQDEVPKKWNSLGEQIIQPDCSVGAAEMPSVLCVTFLILSPFFQQIFTRFGFRWSQWQCRVVHCRMESITLVSFTWWAEAIIDMLECATKFIKPFDVTQLFSWLLSHLIVPLFLGGKRAEDLRPA